MRRARAAPAMAIFARVKGSTPGRIVSFYPVSKKYLAIASSPNPNAAREINARQPCEAVV